MKNWFRYLVSGFSDIKGFDSWVIAKIELSISNIRKDNNLCNYNHIDNSDNICNHAEIIKSNKNHAVLNTHMEYKKLRFSINMLMVKPKEKSLKQLKLNNRQCITDSKKADVRKIDVRETDVKKTSLRYKINNKYNLNDRQYICSFQYDTKSICKFTQDIKDYNCLHKNENPVVPGLMLLEDMLKYVINQDTDLIKSPVPIQLCMLFKIPAYANEKLNIYKAVANNEFMAVSDNNICIFTLY